MARRREPEENDTGWPERIRENSRARALGIPFSPLVGAVRRAHGLFGPQLARRAGDAARLGPLPGLLVASLFVVGDASLASWASSHLLLLRDGRAARARPLDGSPGEATSVAERDLDDVEADPGPGKFELPWVSTPFLLLGSSRLKAFLQRRSHEPVACPPLTATDPVLHAF